MSEPITMPRLSDSMEEGTIVKWLIGDGEGVAAGDELLEVETDKATVTVTAEQDGRLSIVAAEGATVAVGDLIAHLGSGAPAEEERDAAPEIADTDAPPAPAVVSAAGEPAAATGNGAAATPLARRAARLHGVELAGVSGSGPRGRITRDDVLAAAGVSAPAPPAAAGVSAPAPPAAAPPPAGGAHPLTRRQQLVARRMSESRATIPEFEVSTEVAMDAAVALRQQIRAALAGTDEPVPSLNDLIVRACALTLRRHPRLNASYADGAVRIHPDVNIGIAVATDDALIVPVLRGADALSLGAIARESRRLAAAVRAGDISPAELDGGTFTVSNLGMFGMTAIRPVINPPQVAILGVGAIRDTLARAADGAVVDRRLMTLTLSADHRVAYGADAARFLSDVRGLLEEPLGILL